MARVSRILIDRSASTLAEFSKVRNLLTSPVVQSTKLEFVVHLTTARVLGLEIPAIVRALVDEVIE
jgi:hypothetical protein